MAALRALLVKEIRHITRDRRTLAVLVLMPIVQVVLFGFSIRTDVTGVRLAVVDPAPDHATIELRDRLAGTGVFRIVTVLPADTTLAPMFEDGRIQAAIELEPGFARRLGRGENARVLSIVDASEPNSASAIQGYLAAFVQGYGSARGDVREAIGIVPDVRMRFNPTRASSNLFVPGLLAMVLTITAALMTALSLTREKEIGTMEALLVSPLRPVQIIAGKVIPYLLIGVVSTIAVLIEARVLLHVPLRGSAVLLVAEGVLFIIVSLSLGILISARTSSQRVAMMGAMVGTMLPTAMLSGFIFPVESMPRVLQWVSALVPARWFVEIARGIMLKGTGLAYLWPETLVLAAMALALLAASARSFRVRLE